MNFKMKKLPLEYLADKYYSDTFLDWNKRIAISDYLLYYDYVIIE